MAVRDQALQLPHLFRDLVPPDLHQSTLPFQEMFLHVKIMEPLPKEGQGTISFELRPNMLLTPEQIIARDSGDNNFSLSNVNHIRKTCKTRSKTGNSFTAYITSHDQRLTLSATLWGSVAWPLLARFSFTGVSPRALSTSAPRPTLCAAPRFTSANDCPFCSSFRAGLGKEYCAGLPPPRGLAGRAIPGTSAVLARGSGLWNWRAGVGGRGGIVTWETRLLKVGARGIWQRMRHGRSETCWPRNWWEKLDILKASVC